MALQRQTSSGWKTIRTLRTNSRARFKTTIRHRKRADYRVVFFGGPGLIGKASPPHRW